MEGSQWQPCRGSFLPRWFWMGVVVPLAQPRGRASACRFARSSNCAVDISAEGRQQRAFSAVGSTCPLLMSVRVPGLLAFPKFLAGIRQRLSPGCAEASTRSTRQATACSAVHRTRGVRGRRSHDGAAGILSANRRPWSKDVGSDVGGAGSCPASTRRAVRLDRARRGGDTSCLLATPYRRREPELEHRRGEGGLNL
jgi:hypothetical protein